LTAQISKLAGVNANRIRFVGSVNNAEDFLAAANFLCLPSYREGFGLVTIEAAAVGIPTLASRIYGITDAVLDGVTGILHDPGDYISIERGLRELALNPLHCKELGSSAKRRALAFFSSSLVVDAHLHFYKRLIGESKSRA
jgi:glycosyltransferase involved in cell wall biosynthesis